MMIDPYSFYNPYQQRKRKKARYGAINSPQVGGVNRSGLLDRGGYDNRGKQGYQKAKIDRGKISTKKEDKPEEGGGFGGIMAAKEAYESGKEAYDVLSQLGSEEGRKKVYDKWMTKGEEFGTKLDQFGADVQSGINKATDFARNPMGYGKYVDPSGTSGVSMTGEGGITLTGGGGRTRLPPTSPTGLSTPVGSAVSGETAKGILGNLSTGGSEALKQSSNLLQGAGGLGQASSYPLQIGGLGPYKGIEQTYRAGAQAGAGAGTTAGTEAGKQAAKEVSKEGGKQAVSGMSSSTIGTGIAMGTIALEVAMGETQDKLTGSHEVDTAVRLVAAYYTAGFSELFYAFI